MKFRLSMIFILCFHLVFCASSNKKAKEALMNDPAYHFGLGLSFMNSGDYNRAIKHFNDSLLLDPKYYYALSSRGIVNLMRGNLSESEKDLKECLRINPDFAEANNYLGVVYQEMGFLDMAENQFSKALRDKNYKSRELPYYNLARLYYVKRGFKEALDYVQKSIEINKDMELAHNLAGLIYVELGKFDDAIKSYREAIKLSRDNIHLNFNLAVAYFKSNQHNDAREIFNEIYSKTTDKEIKAKIEKYLSLINK